MSLMFVVPYIGTWIETLPSSSTGVGDVVVPYIGTWIETRINLQITLKLPSRTLYRYVD